MLRHRGAVTRQGSPCIVRVLARWEWLSWGIQRSAMAVVREIQVAMDFSGVTDRVLVEARNLAKALGARVLLMHVAKIKANPVGFEVGPDQMCEEFERQLDEPRQKLPQQTESADFADFADFFLPLP